MGLNDLEGALKSLSDRKQKGSEETFLTSNRNNASMSYKSNIFKSSHIEKHVKPKELQHFPSQHSFNSRPKCW